MDTTNAADAAPEQKDVSRRDFLMYIAAGSMALTGLFAARTVYYVVQPPPRSIEGKTKIGPMAVAEVADIKPGEPQIVEYGDDFVWLVKAEDGQVLAMNAACPHVACKLHFNEKTKQFDCPCHASSFSLDGTKLFGPAPRNMIPATYEVTDGKVVVSGFETSA